MLFALCIGHSRIIHGRLEGGAVSVGKVSEHAFNSAVAALLERKLAELGHASVTYAEYQGAGYLSATRWLGGRMNVHRPRFAAAVELHFNSSDDPASHGHEYLYLKGSVKGERLARCMAEAHAANYQGHRSRGIIPIVAGKRGYGFLRNTPPPACILEPFFGSNPAEWARFAADPERLAATYAAGLHAFSKLP